MIQGIFLDNWVSINGPKIVLFLLVSKNNEVSTKHLKNIRYEQLFLQSVPIFARFASCSQSSQINEKMKRKQERINTETIDYIAKFIVTVKSGRKGNLSSNFYREKSVSTFVHFPQFALQYPTAVRDLCLVGGGQGKLPGKKKLLMEGKFHRLTGHHLQ